MQFGRYNYVALIKPPGCTGSLISPTTGDAPEAQPCLRQSLFSYERGLHAASRAEQWLVLAVCS